MARLRKTLWVKNSYVHNIFGFSDIYCYRSGVVSRSRFSRLLACLAAGWRTSSSSSFFGSSCSLIYWHHCEGNEKRSVHFPTVASSPPLLRPSGVRTCQKDPFRTDSSFFLRPLQEPASKKAHPPSVRPVPSGHPSVPFNWHTRVYFRALALSAEAAYHPCADSFNWHIAHHQHFSVCQSSPPRPTRLDGWQLMGGKSSSRTTTMRHRHHHQRAWIFQFRNGLGWVPPGTG